MTAISKSGILLIRHLIEAIGREKSMIALWHVGVFALVVILVALIRGWWDKKRWHVSAWTRPALEASMLSGVLVCGGIALGMYHLANQSVEAEIWILGILSAVIGILFTTAMIAFGGAGILMLINSTSDISLLGLMFRLPAHWWQDLRAQNKFTPNQHHDS